MHEPSRPRWWALALGAASLVALGVALVAVPRGPAEFAYAPFDLAWPWGLGRGWGVAELLSYGIGASLGGGAVGLLAWGLAPVVPLPAPGSERRAAAAIGVLSLALAAIGMLFVIRGRPLVPDELSYAEQARQLWEGRLLAPVPDGFVIEAFDIASPTGVGVTAKYLFGEAVVQMPGVLVGLPGLMHLPLLALACWALWRAAALHADEAVAGVVLGMIALSPMLLWVTGTGLSHTPAFAGIAVAALGEATILRGRAWRGAVLVGLGVGFAGIVRPQVAVAVGGVFFAFSVLHLVRIRPAALLGLVLPPLVFGALIAAYDVAVTGEALRLPWSISGESWGFGTPVPGVAHVHGVVEALQNLLTSGVRFSVWWLGWPTGLVFVWLFLRVGRPLGGLRSWVVASLAEIVFLFGYYAPGIYDVGPIYYLECTLGAAALGGCGLVGLYARVPRFTGSLAMVWLVVGVPAMWAWGGLRLDRLLDHVNDPAEVVLAQVPWDGALLLVEADCSERIAAGSMMVAFPERRRLRSHGRVVVPRPSPDRLDTLLDFYGPRRCYYAHRDPVTRDVAVSGCDAAGEWLARPRAWTAPSECPRVRSFAEQWGLRAPLDAAP